MSTGIDRSALLERFERNRARSRELFSMIPDASYQQRPIPLRHPIVFYDGHLPAFSVNTLAKKGHGLEGVDAALEELFERGIDPGSPNEADAATITRWPSREAVAEYGCTADALVRRLLAEAPLQRRDRPAMIRGEAACNILEHEPMHHETLLYIFHALDPSRKQMPPRELATARPGPDRGMIAIPPGRARLGAARDEIPFGWDNEFEALEIDVGAFEIAARNVTNGDYLEFVGAGGYRDAKWWTEEGWRWVRESGVEHPHFWIRRDGAWRWRGMRGEIDLPAGWPVWVTHAEAAAYAKWKGLRLPTEAEYHRAAYGDPSGKERLHPWGDDEPDERHGNFDFRSWDPVAAGSFPEGASAWGVDDLVGNGWEWTSTPFAPLPGFRPMASYPQYSAEFFDGAHYVLKGASPATSRELVRRSFRNWFRPAYPWVWASFRCARG
ncbi:MAG TPA: SUMF1/EgtB/PvdO family nonheme iron enzyme [Thermoanaerobaculia bacterium]|nr:SUMF1/EgtB/PvdO family nonheme iron enzyme [Thermoanaerobaculia bacterium]